MLGSPVPEYDIYTQTNSVQQNVKLYSIMQDVD